MNKERWLLPEGIEELLPPQAQQLESLRRVLLDMFDRWGYELVMPPLVEYLESLLIGNGNDLEIQTFKLTDQLNGRMMGVRADITPQVARIDAHRMSERDGPVRLCYQGTVLHTRGDGLGGSRSFTQIGAELFGHVSVEADAEMVCLMLETLDLAGIDQVNVDLGHVGIFRALSKSAGLSDEQETILFDALQRKAMPEVESLLANLKLDESLRKGIADLAGMNGGIEVLETARKRYADNKEVLGALDEINHVAKSVSASRPNLRLHFDLAELRGFRYHTGLVFAAYQKGQGRAIAQGGRYDDIGKVFGRARAATGFSADMRALISLSASAASKKGSIFSPASDDTALVEKIRELRDAGERVVCELKGQAGGASEAGSDRVLVLTDGQWLVKES
ncbi:MAG: ATP phosphoribosyltransferase regulatory subunit [Gammaproteobacteria bacterium]